MPLDAGFQIWIADSSAAEPFQHDAIGLVRTLLEEEQEAPKSSIGYIPQMAIVSVLYPKTADSRFDHDYYVETHARLVKARWSGMGLVSATFTRGASQLDDGEHAFEMIDLLTFSSADQLKVALAAHGEENGRSPVAK